jgi:hypothetical protein
LPPRSLAADAARLEAVQKSLSRKRASRISVPAYEAILSGPSGDWQVPCCLGAHREDDIMAAIADLPIPLERDGFVRRLIRELAGTLQDVVGVHDAAGYITVVGAAMGEHIDSAYRNALQVERLDRQQVAEVLVDLKKRIEGKFYVKEEAEDRIVFGNSACPFGDMVRDRPSLCMMTSNVFGHIAAQNLGYAGVELKETIAEGAPRCTVVVHLRPKEDQPLGTMREYFRRDPSAKP